MFCINWPKCLLKLHLRAFSFSQSSKFLAICSFNEALDLSVKGVTKLPKLQSLDKKNLLKFVVIVHWEYLTKRKFFSIPSCKAKGSQIKIKFLYCSVFEEYPWMKDVLKWKWGKLSLLKICYFLDLILPQRFWSHAHKVPPWKWFFSQANILQPHSTAYEEGHSLFTNQNM